MKISVKQAGFSLVEILLVLGIIALLAISAFVIYPQVRDASNANREAQNLTTIISGIRNLFGNTSTYQGLTTSLVNQAGIFPKTMNSGILTTTQPIEHTGRGLVEISSWDADMRRFSIMYRDVPSQLCVKLAQNYGKDVDEVIVDGVTVKMAGSLGSNPVLTMTQCNSLDKVDINFIQK
jgi:prepilin-type N-terminal cleavage/methylation domain-containing protein